jgi:hypothetical protein
MSTPSSHDNFDDAVIMSTPSAHDNFDEWLDAWLVTHPYDPGNQDIYVYSKNDMFSAWVGGAIFVANKMFNPTWPPPLPDIFREQGLAEHHQDEMQEALLEVDEANEQSTD